MQIGREHLPGPIDQIVRLVDQEDVVPSPFCEVPLQKGSGIEDVVVVADNGVDPQREVERKFERADLVLAGRLFDDWASEGVLLEDLLQRVVDPVEIADGVFALLRIAGSLPLRSEADLVACRQGQTLQPQSLSPQIVDRLLGHRAHDRLGGQIEDLLHQPFPHRHDRRKQG